MTAFSHAFPGISGKAAENAPGKLLYQWDTGRMASISRIQVAWTGSSVTGGGLSTFYTMTHSSVLTSSVAAFFNAIKAVLPSTTDIVVPGNGDTFDETNGQLNGTWSTGASTSLSGTGSGSYARGVGARVAWRTGTIRGGRRVRGSTFIAPIIVASYETDGSLQASTVTTIETAANGLITALSGDLIIWSRPRPGLAGVGVPADSALVPDQVSWLRSRRT